MTESTSYTDPELPAGPGVHVHVNVNQGAPTPTPTSFAPSWSMIKYAAIGIIVICALIGFAAAKLISMGVITIGL